MVVYYKADAQMITQACMIPHVEQRAFAKALSEKLCDGFVRCGESIAAVITQISSNVFPQYCIPFHLHTLYTGAEDYNEGGGYGLNAKCAKHAWPIVGEVWGGMMGWEQHACQIIFRPFML